MKIDGSATALQLAYEATQRGQTPPQPLPHQPSDEVRELRRAAHEVNASGALGENEIRFAMDEGSRRPVMRIVDRNTNEVVQQIPPEQLLQLAQALKWTRQGGTFL